METSGSETKYRTVTLGVPGGISVTIINLGATVQSIRVPCRGEMVGVVLSYPDLQQYGDDSWYMGATVGRFANRIGNARFLLDGTRFDLDANETSTGHCLHGGAAGLNRQFFELDSSAGNTLVACRHVSPAGSAGFPARLDVTVTYELIDEYSLAIDYRATADQDTVVNLANHSYFDLGGAIDEQVLLIHAESYTPVDESFVPTGEIRNVANSEFDLRQPTRLRGRRFDHNFVLPSSSGDLKLAAELRSPTSGIGLKLHTTQPGLQLYTADYLEAPFGPRQGLCLEAQGFPDAPNHPGFPSTRLSAGQVYRQRTVYEFLVDASDA